MALRDTAIISHKRLAKKHLSPFTLASCPLPLNSKGFTLVELAVVLVILGTIFMSVLKVESMVKNAKIRQVVNQYRELRTAILVYKDKYGYLPGDDPYADVHVGSTRMGNGDGYVYGTGGYEWFPAFEHLNKAGLIKGKIPSAADPVKHVFNGSVYITMQIISGIKYNYIRFDDLPGDVAQALDTALDDGISDHGIVQSGNVATLISGVWLITPASSYSSSANMGYTLIKYE